LKEFEGFPKDAQSIFLTALTIAADGAKQILRSQCWDWALGFRGGAFRVVYALQLADEVWVIHAFQKKSKQGIKTPKHEIELVRERLRRLKEALR